MDLVQRRMLGDETDVIFNALQADESKAPKYEMRDYQNHARFPTSPGCLMRRRENASASSYYKHFQVDPDVITNHESVSIKSIYQIHYSTSKHMHFMIKDCWSQLNLNPPIFWKEYHRLFITSSWQPDLAQISEVQGVQRIANCNIL